MRPNRESVNQSKHRMFLVTNEGDIDGYPHRLFIPRW